MLFILTFIVIWKQFAADSVDDCGTKGLGLKIKHDCECKSDCNGDHRFCNRFEFVANRLDEGEVSASCSDGDLCCCSCPNCEGYTERPTTTRAVCDTEDAFNIAWLLDESGSVDAVEWQNVIALVDRLHKYDLPATSYSTLFEFASYPGFEQFLDWTPVEDPVGSGDRSAFSDALYANHYNQGGQTFTWHAVNRVLDEFWDYRFSCDDGCDTRSDVLIVMTDGRPTDMVCPNITNRVNQTDIDVIVIGVGLSPSQIESIACLDVKDGGADILSVPSYDEINLETLDLEVRNRVCTGENGVIPGVRPEAGTQWVYDNGDIGLGPVPTRSEDRSGNRPGDT